jgi:hypothetical protein
MKYDTAGLIALVNARFDENINQDISGVDANEVFLAFLDSFAVKSAPVQLHELNIMLQDLDINKQVDIDHSLSSTDLKIVLYDPQGYRVFNTHYEWYPVDTGTIRITFIAGIPYKRSYKGYIIKIA